MRLDHHPALDTRALLPFLAARAVPGVEEVVDGAYRRSLPDGSLLRLRPREGAVEVDGDEEAARAILRLDADPDAILARLGDDPLLGPLVRAAPGRRIPGHPDPAELAVRALLGQQVSVAAARTLAGRLVANDDAFLPPDLGVRHGLAALGADPLDAFAFAFALAERWRPYRAFAVAHLWATAAG